MADVSIRNLDDAVRDRLRRRAAAHGRSMEAEIREILTSAVSEPEETNIVAALSYRFARLGGVELDIPERSDPPRAADFST